VLVTAVSCGTTEVISTLDSVSILDSVLDSVGLSVTGKHRTLVPKNAMSSTVLNTRMLIDNIDERLLVELPSTRLQLVNLSLST